MQKNIQTIENCDVCKGAGIIFTEFDADSYGMPICYQCNGVGKIIVTHVRQIYKKIGN